MAKLLLGVLTILGIDLLVIGLVCGIIFVVCTGWEEQSRRRQARRFAEAVAGRDFAQAENHAKRAFLADVVGEQTSTRSIDTRQ
jgi:hypothetical protein